MLNEKTFFRRTVSSEKGKLGYHFDSGSGEIGSRSVVARVVAVFGLSWFLVLNLGFGS